MASFILYWPRTLFPFHPFCTLPPPPSPASITYILQVPITYHKNVCLHFKCISGL